MSGFNVINAECSGDCTISQQYFSCMRIRTEVLSALPETGIEGTTYLIGDNVRGYVEYVWNGERFVLMGAAGGMPFSVATTTELGLVKISDAKTAGNSSAVILNENNQLIVPFATLKDPGAVCLGSAFQATNGKGYLVGIGASKNKDTYGQLCFNLAMQQPVEGVDESDEGSYLDEPGCLRYRKKPGTSTSAGTYQAEMYVTLASDTQLGVVKLLSTINGYSEEELVAKRNTHAASVGLIVEGLDSFCEGFFKDNRMQGYFDNWALGKDLANQIWDDANKKAVLLDTVTENIIASSVVTDTINTKTNELVTAWLNNTVTPQYIDDMFSERVIKKTTEIVDANWTNRLEATIAGLTQTEVSVQLVAGIAEWFGNADNVRAVADIIVDTVSDEITQGAAEKAVEYTKGLFDGVNTMTVDGAEVLFEDWCSSKIEALVQNQLNGVTSQIQSLRNEVMARVESLKDGSFTSTLVGTIKSDGDVLDCSDYDYIEIRTNKNSCFCIPVWSIKRAFASGKYYFFLDVWGIHDDDTEYDGSQIRIAPGWKFHLCSDYTPAFPLEIYGLKYTSFSA